MDDDINEAEQQFVCIVRVLDTSLVTSGRVNFTNRATVIKIVDNDRKSCHIWVDGTYPYMAMWHMSTSYSFNQLVIGTSPCTCHLTPYKGAVTCV